MGTWHEYLKAAGTPPEWPYPVKFGEEREEEADRDAGPKRREAK